jgi:hypothetical protein
MESVIIHSWDWVSMSSLVLLPNMGPLCQLPMADQRIEHLIGENLSIRRKTCHSVTLSTTQSKWTALGLNTTSAVRIRHVTT